MAILREVNDPEPDLRFHLAVSRPAHSGSHAFRCPRRRFPSWERNLPGGVIPRRSSRPAGQANLKRTSVIALLNCFRLYGFGTTAWKPNLL